MGCVQTPFKWTVFPKCKFLHNLMILLVYWLCYFHFCMFPEMGLIQKIILNNLLPGIHPVGVQRSSKLWCSSIPSDSDIGNDDTKNNGAEDGFDDFIGAKKDVNLQPQGVDPRRGWGFRGVHKAIICGKVGQAPVQKILRNGRTVTIFTVGTGGMFDQRVMGAKDLPRPAQWHRIAVHNETLGAYAVKQLVKNASIYVEGDIETRVYNDSINGEVKHIPEICIRHDGKLRLIKTGESISSISLDDLREDLL
ncbi:single-stranded DNA-binding protein, mitochondrial-like isoform X1 [Pyrus x bretschneideri]|uniref:single-stranded DNA-binding protein, mitochondrial-like isoform X1 n=1 Tax=Pyrus x bretschneideri TaxID=225117 RepID=UPI00202E6FAF|nr:single-stranded DNA-binding protein, mitochondrial-like isoform X1 [Pyrus x bretschneideri]